MIRKRSAKMEALYRKRRPFVAKFLEDHPTCNRCLEMNHGVVLDGNYGNMRSTSGLVQQSGGCQRYDSLLQFHVTDGCVFCRPSVEVHDHPAQATEEGFLKSGKVKFGEL